MVIAFEGAYGGHAIGTYNRQLQLLWAGVIPKKKREMDNENGKLLVQAGKSALNIILKQPAKPSYSRRAYCLRAYILPTCLPRMNC